MDKIISFLEQTGFAAIADEPKCLIMIVYPCNNDRNLHCPLRFFCL